MARTLSREEILMTATAFAPRLDTRMGAGASEAASVRSVSAASVAGVPSRAAQPKLRLTRRGRVVFGVLATVLIAGVFGVVASIVAPGAIANSSESSQEFPYVVAQTGDSLWSIASALDPAADPRDTVAEIERLNQIHAVDLQAGDSIAVPLRFAGDELTFAATTR